ncbi:hypothetical protein BABINDRAFT_166286 [Babjeviella inositovora NRRL Y-12698]|uniref:Signal recognition particle subunit SRP14 n=1 Tax=Babjeviella inositovora NRRL Y-12698 TaxID=984486 RepID=A0A1E3QSK1_9ASCO|nr:uncharacterized protein BABINDRAFT_166286 [Babjeviella inositovora NRRL Y-12698]ODQ80686.1 hypothetical protein BABINDRAFT_166286 [Babjeviella inositovora NRRL Y-12698]
MSRISNEEFLTSVTSLLQQSGGNSSVYFTQKRLLPFDEVEGQLVSADSTYSVLLRATDGGSKKSKNRKLKFSTVIESDKLDSFWSEYANVLKNGMTGLKKKEKKKSKKTKKTGVSK